jgi:hypothetical protein
VLGCGETMAGIAVAFARMRAPRQLSMIGK